MERHKPNCSSEFLARSNGFLEYELTVNFLYGDVDVRRGRIASVADNEVIGGRAIARFAFVDTILFSLVVMWGFEDGSPAADVPAGRRGPILRAHVVIDRI
jgi:hypothetical protein